MKFRKITAGMMAAVVAATSIVASAPMTVSAKEVTLPLKSYSIETNGAVNSDADKYTIYSDGTFNMADVKTIEVYYTGITTSYIQPVVQLNQQDANWDGIYPAGYFEPSISNGTSTLIVKLGTTQDKDGNTIDWSSEESYVNKSICLYFGWMNAGSCNLNKVVLKDSSGSVLKTVEGETVSSVTPTADVPLTAVSETNSEKTAYDAGGWIADKDWTANFLSDITAKATAAYYTSAIEYLNEFEEITFKIKVNDCSGKVKIGDLQAQVFYSCTDYSWSSGLPATAIDEKSKEYTLTLPISSLPAADEKTLAQLGIQFYDSTNFTAVGDTGMLDYSVEATLVLSAEKSITIGTAANGSVTSDKTAAKLGDTVKLTVTPDAGYEYKTADWTIEPTGITLTADPANANVYTFEMPGEDVTITPAFTAVNYTVTDYSDTNGNKVEADKDTATIGKTVSLTVTPAAGYKLKDGSLKVTSGTNEVTVTDNAFTMPAGNVTVSAEFEAIEAASVSIPETLSVLTGKTNTLTAEVTPADALNKTVTWKSADTTIATVDTKGVVTGVKAGTTTITATTANGKVSNVCTVTVTDEEVKTESITVDKTAVELTVGDTATVKATVNPANSTDAVVWSVKDSKVATVNGGVITAVAPGTTTVTVTSGEKSAEVAVTVKAKTVAVTSVALDKETAEVKEGETVTLTATVKPTDATDKTVTWTSSDEKVATVKDGVVTAVAAGEATITAKAGDKTAACTVTVKAVPKAPENGVIYSGSQDMGTDWKNSIQADPFIAKEGQTVKITFSVGSGSYQQIKVMDGSWTPLTSLTGLNDYGCVELDAKAASYTFTLNAADAKKMAEGGLVITGYNVTVTKVELIDAPEATDTYTIADPKNIPVNTTMTQTMKNADGTKNIRFVQKVSVEDAKANKNAELTLSNGKGTTTVKVTKCYSSIKATVNGVADTVVEAGDGYVFIVYTMGSVPADVNIVCTNTDWLKIVD